MPDPHTPSFVSLARRVLWLVINWDYKLFSLAGGRRWWSRRRAIGMENKGMSGEKREARRFSWRRGKIERLSVGYYIGVSGPGRAEWDNRQQQPNVSGEKKERENSLVRVIDDGGEEIERNSHFAHDRGNLVGKINSLINCQVWTESNLSTTTFERKFSLSSHTPYGAVHTRFPLQPKALNAVTGAQCAAKSTTQQNASFLPTISDIPFFPPHRAHILSVCSASHFQTRYLWAHTKKRNATANKLTTHPTTEWDMVEEQRAHLLWLHFLSSSSECVLNARNKKSNNMKTHNKIPMLNRKSERRQVAIRKMHLNTRSALLRCRYLKSHHK